MILAIETSCDETAAAVINQGKVLANIVYSQVEKHQIFGGVMPELASRLHVESIVRVIDLALKEAGVSLSMIKAIAVTNGPGLMGSLHVGLQAAKALSLSLGIPLIGVNHIIGHIYSNLITQSIPFPALGLVVSGGHTELVKIENDFKIEILGATLDDAVGETYDKVARVLGLPYPGGPLIDRLSKLGVDKYKFPFPKNDKTLEFSFSGLKTAVINIINKMSEEEKEKNINDLATSFQNHTVNILMQKTKAALSNGEYASLLIAGGVAANSLLRAKIKELESDKLKVIIPEIKYCGDNAAMIGIVGEIYYNKQKFDDLELAVNPNLEVKEK